MEALAGTPQRPRQRQPTQTPLGGTAEGEAPPIAPRGASEKKSGGRGAPRAEATSNSKREAGARRAAAARRRREEATPTEAQWDTHQKATTTKEERPQRHKKGIDRQTHL